MSNHVHVLIRPLQQPTRLLQSLKGTTAREANLILARTGQPFWQHESYDHWVRDQPELERIVAYIESNPVKAGLAAEPFLYRWSSAWRGDGELKFAAARVSVRHGHTSYYFAWAVFAGAPVATAAAGSERGRDMRRQGNRRASKNVNRNRNKNAATPMAMIPA